MQTEANYISQGFQRSMKALGELPDYFIPRELTNMQGMFYAGFASAMKIVGNIDPLDFELRNAVFESISNELQEWNRKQMQIMINPDGRDMRYFSTKDNQQ